jgi:multidrug efflux system membrane fusion protein
VKLKGTFTNKERRLWPGEFVDVVLNLSTHKNAILAPTKAVQSGQQGDYVYVVTAQSTAESRNIQSAGTYENMTLVSAGVQPGEKVIVDGLVRVAPNAKVAVKNATENSPARQNTSGSRQ